MSEFDFDVITGPSIPGDPARTCPILPSDHPAPRAANAPVARNTGLPSHAMIRERGANRS